MSHAQDRFDRLRLIRTPNIGPVTYRQLLARFGSAKAALDALPDLAARGGKRGFTIASSETVEGELEAADRLGARMLFLGDSSYPVALADVENAPPVLFAKGNVVLFDRSMVAIVGARNASAGACRFARQLAFDLGESGYVTVSGLARGIDTAAHVGSIGSGTVGVIAGGIDIAYPPENARLQDEIAEKGLLLAEQPPGLSPKARHFPFRNRIIAGLTLGTVVIEAAPRSGSLITARLAGEMGREVMAVPGSPLDPRAQGCNQLIREGAILVQNSNDVNDQIAPFDHRAERHTAMTQAILPNASANEVDSSTVLQLLGMDYVSVDELARQSRHSVPVLQMALLELELSGRLERGAGGKVRLSA